MNKPTKIISDGEVINPIVEDDDGNVVITEDHTIADIARWIVNSNCHDDLIYCIYESLINSVIDSDRERIKTLIKNRDKM